LYTELAETAASGRILGRGLQNYKIEHTSDRVAMFHVDWLREHGDLALKKRKEKKH